MTDIKRPLTLSGNALKILAAIFMLIDHIGLILLPSVTALRCVGRLAFPIFAFFIAEGCRYTKNKLRYFLTMLSFGVIMQIIYFAFFRIYDDLSVMMTFSVSLPLLFSFDYMKRMFFAKDVKVWKRVAAAALFVILCAAAFLVSRLLKFDYGFPGMALPLFAAVNVKCENMPQSIAKLDTLPVRLAIYAVGLALFCFNVGGIQYFALLSLLFLALYSEKRGKWRMKYFFYLFYPLHLALLYGIYYVISYM